MQTFTRKERIIIVIVRGNKQINLSFFEIQILQTKIRSKTSSAKLMEIKSAKKIIVRNTSFRDEKRRKTRRAN